MNRRGYFFVVDAVIASVILFVGLFALFGGGARSEDSVQPLATIEDTLQTLGTQPVSATLDPYYTGTLLPAGLVPYPEATPLELITYLNVTDCGDPYCDEHAYNYTRSLFTTTLGSEYGAYLIINDSKIYQQDHDQRYLLTRSFVVYTRVNDTNYTGPLVAELALWN
jgi:hypothetical protein